MTRQTQKTFTNSSNVRKMQYSEANKIMQVTFTSGMTYQYFDVSVTVWDAALLADSIGGFINSKIKGKYKYSKV